MESADRYWSGVYWDGIMPEQIGAVDLSDAASSEAHINGMLEKSRQLVQQAEQYKDTYPVMANIAPVDEYALTIVDMLEEGGDSDESADVPAAPSSSSSSTQSTPAPPSATCDGTCMIIRLWHMDVFLGARESGKGDPSQRCVDLHFQRSEPYSFSHATTLEETEALLERKQQPQSAPQDQQDADQ